jgi:hypothetical protein
MKASLTSGKYPLRRRSIALAVTLAILIPIAPHKASAKGGTFLWSHLSPVSRAEAKIETSSRPETTPLTIRGCDGKRYRDPNTHRCRGPADVGN